MSEPHLALIEFIEEAAKKMRWKLVRNQRYYPSNYYFAYSRDSSLGNRFSRKQKLKIVIDKNGVSMVKTASDGMWYDKATVFNLANPDSLEKIERYFTY